MGIPLSPAIESPSANLRAFMEERGFCRPFPDCYHAPKETRKGGVALICGDRLLVVHERGSGKWGIPKGSVEPSDSNLLAAALRELREETGIDGSTFLCTDIQAFKVQDLLTVFVIVVPTLPESYLHNNPEIANICWLPLSLPIMEDFNYVSRIAIRHLHKKRALSNVPRVADLRCGHPHTRRSYLRA